MQLYSIKDATESVSGSKKTPSKQYFTVLSKYTEGANSILTINDFNTPFLYRVKLVIYANSVKIKEKCAFVAQKNTQICKSQSVKEIADQLGLNLLSSHSDIYQIIHKEEPEYRVLHIESTIGSPRMYNHTSDETIRVYCTYKQKPRKFIPISVIRPAYKCGYTVKPFYLKHSIISDYTSKMLCFYKIKSANSPLHRNKLHSLLNIENKKIIQSFKKGDMWLNNFSLTGDEA